MFLLSKTISKLLSEYSSTEGAKALAVLIEHSGHEIDCIQLNHLMSPPDFCLIERIIKDVVDDDAKHTSSPNLQMPNPFKNLGHIMLCDRKTIRDVYARLNKLIAMKAEILNTEKPDAAKLDIIDQEISALKKYLGEVLRPGGAIRSIHPEEKRASQRVSVAISRLLKKAEKEHPEAVAIIRQNLRMGKSFRFNEVD